MPDYIEKIDRTNLPVVPLRGIVVFPQNSISIELNGAVAMAALDAAKQSGTAFFVMQKDASDRPDPDTLYETGCIAKIKQTIRMNEKSRRIVIEGVNRASAMAYTKKGDLLTADLLVKWTHASDNGGLRGEAYMREAVGAFEKLVAFMPKLSNEVSAAVKSIGSMGLLADFIACHVLVRPGDKQKVLEAVDPMKRIQTVIAMMYDEQQLLETEMDIQSKVQERLNRNQREYIMREQLKLLKEELGEK